MHLKAWMEANGKTDSDVAVLVGRDRSIVSRLRRDELRPTAELMERIAEATAGAVMPNDWFPDLPAEAA